MKVCLIDGDILVYKCMSQHTVYYVEEDSVAYRYASQVDKAKTRTAITVVEPFDTAKEAFDSMLNRVLNDVGTKSFRIFLTGSGNFRKELDAEYKANRKGPKPIHFANLRKHIVENYDGLIIDYYEADDAIGICSERLKEQGVEVVIASTDKDFLTLPEVSLYNFDKREFTKSVGDGGMALMYQMLVGDTADNIKGIHRVGDKKATEMLKDLTFEEAEKLVRKLYDDDERYERNIKLLTILTAPHEDHEDEVRDIEKNLQDNLYI
jgi:5'-3' exonuclease